MRLARSLGFGFVFADAAHSRRFRLGIATERRHRTTTTAPALRGLFKRRRSWRSGFVCIWLFALFFLAVARLTMHRHVALLEQFWECRSHSL
mmetsp:Transcript_62392/g.179442  ORF Transcript_62392/g.179442 Transcript_62392/m.179442 type:complete len:92 (+) Transcript_62392:280-555(+)